MTAYRDDLAHIHDTGFGRVAEAAAPVLLDALSRRGHAGGLVVDLGCGGGILARPVAEAGHDVLGIDGSPAMLRIARERVPGGRFVEESWLDVDIPTCVAVAAIGEVFNYLFDPRNTPRALDAVLRRIARALAPGGVLLTDVAGPGRGPRQAHTIGDDWAVLVTAEEDRRRRILTRQITSFRRDGPSYRRDEETHRLRLMPPEAFAARLRGLGLRVRALRGYGPFRFPTGWTGFLATKP